jgi:hypothetical protein
MCILLACNSACADVVRCHVYVSNEMQLAEKECAVEVDMFEKAWAVHEQRLTQTVLKVSRSSATAALVSGTG